MKAAWKPVYERISIPARAEWSAFELSLREITQLRVGDVIEMPAEHRRRNPRRAQRHAKIYWHGRSR